MKLHRLLLENFRGVHRRDVSFPERGVIVVSGPNEVGKSSLIEALDLLLEEKDSAAKATVRAVKPVRADVGSAVEAEISTGPYRFVYRKQFHRNTSTTLTVISPTAEQLTGTPAHERVRQMLAQTVDEKLYKALRLLQATPLGQAELADSDALATALDLAAGAAGNPADGESLIAAARRCYLVDFTPGGRPRGEHKAISEELAAAEHLARQAADALAVIGTELDRLETALQRRDRADARLSASRAALAEARARREQEQQRDIEAERAAQVARTVAAQLHRARAARQQRVDLIGALHLRRAEIADLAHQDAELRVAAEGLQARLDEQSDLVATRVTDQRQARLLAGRIRAQLDRAQRAAELVRLDRQIGQVTRAATDLDRYRVEMAATAVDVGRWQELTDAAAAYDTACCEQRAGAAVVSVLAPAGTQVWVAGDRQQGAGPVDYPVTDDLIVTTADGVTLTIRPARTAEALAIAVDRARARRDQLLADIGVVDLTAAQLRHEQYRAAAAAAERAGGALAAALGSDDIAGLTARRDQLRAEMAPDGNSTTADIDVAAPRSDLDASAGGGTAPARSTATSVPDDRVPEDPVPDDAGLDDAEWAALLVPRADADAAAEAADRSAAAAVAERDRRRDEHHAAALRAERAASTMTARADEMQRWADELAAARTTDTDDDLAAAEADAERAHADVINRRPGSDPALAPSGAGIWPDSDTHPPSAAGTAAATVEAASVASIAAERDAKESDKAVAEIQGRLEVIGGQGRQDDHDRAQSDLAAIHRRHRAISHRASAARLLYQALSNHRDRARESYVQPFTEQLNSLGAAVFGPGVEFTVAPELTVLRRTLDGTTVSFDQLSTGAREQLAVIMRLAAARMVAEVDRVPIFLDDALGYADSARLAGVGIALALAGQDAQVILLTCDSRRFEALPGAQVISLGRVGDDARGRAEPALPAAPTPNRLRPGPRPFDAVPAHPAPALFDAPIGQNAHRPAPTRPRTARRTRAPVSN